MIDLAPPIQTEMSANADFREFLAMGTRLTISLGCHPDHTEHVLEEVNRIEQWGSTWGPESWFSLLNAQPGQWLDCPPEIIRLLEICLEWNRLTEGAFDPMLGALVAPWGLRSGGRRPSPRVSVEAFSRSGLRHLELDRHLGRVRVLTPGAGIEEGGFLKGYALDRAKEIAQTPDGWVDLGGQVMVWGRPRLVTIASPGNRTRAQFSLRLSDASLATSGQSERGPHLMDPRSGQPVPNWGSVSVVSPSALAADILSTALYVLGPEKGLRWAEQHQIAALFVPHDGAPVATSFMRRLGPLLHER